MNGNCIEIIGLTYKEIFKNFSIAFEEKKFITVVGPNNCGKTTLIRIIDNQNIVNNTILIYGKKQEEYKLTELNNIIKTIIPTEISFIQNTVEEELCYQLPSELSKDIKQKMIKEISKKFKINKILTKLVENLSEKEIIRLQLALSLITRPKIILIDDLNLYFEKKELIEIIKLLKKITEDDKITIIMVTGNLEYTLESDYIYVIDDSKIMLEGKPKEVLEKDNTLNKIGLELPFMMDLSVKLRDYDLIKMIELDMEGMVNILWN